MLEELQDRFNKPCTVVWMKENRYWALSEFSLGGQCRKCTRFIEISITKFGVIYNDFLGL